MGGRDRGDHGVCRDARQVAGRRLVTSGLTHTALPDNYRTMYCGSKLVFGEMKLPFFQNSHFTPLHSI